MLQIILTAKRVKSGKEKVAGRRAGIGLLVIALLLTGCPLFSRPPSLSDGYLIPSTKPLESEAVSLRACLVGDNQTHNVYNEPVLFRSEVADKLVQSAIRPVQLGLYGPRLLEWLVDVYLLDTPIIHLGDACDFSCTGEFDRFHSVIKQAQGPWVMAPGNHDGFFFGNAHLDPDLLGQWRNACANAGEPLTKDIFVSRYLAALSLQQGPDYQALERTLGLDTAQAQKMGLEERAAAIHRSWSASVSSSHPVSWDFIPDEGNPPPFLEAAAWYIDPREPWKSFVVQRLDLTLYRGTPTVVKAIVVDTANYTERPRFMPGLNAGTTGDLTDEQLTIVRGWLKARRAGELWVLIGHHPFDELTAKARDALEELRKQAKVPLYVSAHTHDGRYIIHEDGKQQWIELNVGSVLDWPTEFRELHFYKVEDRLMLRSPRHQVQEEISKECDPLARQAGTKDPQCVTAEAMPTENDYYLSHERFSDVTGERTEVRLKNVLLAAYARLIRCNPTDKEADQVTTVAWPPGCTDDDGVLRKIEAVRKVEGLDEKISLLLQLEAFENSRVTANEDQHAIFQRCQAIWASKYDFVHARKPMVDDAYVIFP